MRRNLLYKNKVVFFVNKLVKNHKLEICLFLLLITTFILPIRENKSKSENLPDISYYPLYSYAYEYDFTWEVPDVEFCYDIVIDDMDNLYLAGTTGLPYYMLIGKFDTAGKQIWNYTGNLGQIKKLALDSLRDIYAISENNLIKIKADGELNWTKSFNTTLSAIKISSNDSIFLAGTGGSYFLMKCNSSGDIIWNATWSAMTVKELQIDSIGDIYLAGSTNSLGAGGSDAIVAKFNSTGCLVWYKTFGGPDNEVGNTLITDNLRNVYLAGSIDYGSHYDTDMFVAKFNENGTHLWHKYCGTHNNYESCRSIFLRNESYASYEDYLFLCGEKYYGSYNRYFCIYSIGASSSSFQGTYHEWLGPQEYMPFSSAIDSNENIWMGGFLRSKTTGNYDMCVARFGKDSDREGLSDAQENLIYHTNPDNSDTDYDWLTDFEEIMIYNTNPNNPDTDGDGMNDYDEILKGFNPNNPFSSENFNIIILTLSVLGAIIGIPLAISIIRDYIIKRKHST